MNKKILIISGIFPPDIGGPASYARSLANHLSELGSGVGVISYSKQWKTSSLQNGYSVTRVWKRWPWAFRHIAFLVKSIRLAKNTDILYALNIVSGGLTALLIKKLSGKKVVVRVAGDYAWQVAVEKGKTDLLIDEFQGSKKRGWIGLLWKIQTFVCTKADLIIVPSEYLAGLVRGWGVPAENIKIVYNGVDFAPSSVPKEDARREIGVSGNIVLTAGRLVPWKGFRMLIKIMPQLLTVNQFFRLVIAGEGPDKKKLEAMIKNLNLERQVVLTGALSQEKLALYLNAADLFVLNTGYEGFSHQILEAMRAGVPIITTPVGGNVEVMVQGENGLMIRYNDEANLVEAIKTLWSHQDLQEQFVQAGKETTATYSVERMLTETVKTLNSL